MAKNWNKELTNDIKLSTSQAEVLCSEMYKEIRGLDAKTLKAITDSFAPLSIDSIYEEYLVFEGTRMLSGALEQMTEYIGELPSVFLTRAQVVFENYFCFVYLRESLFVALRDNLKKSHNSFASFRCAQYLMKDDIREFRNAIAHATWDYQDSTKKKAIIYWVNGTKHKMSEERWHFLQMLSCATALGVTLGITKKRKRK
jgi:hypothetical protein